MMMMKNDGDDDEEQFRGGGGGKVLHIASFFRIPHQPTFLRMDFKMFTQ